MLFWWQTAFEKPFWKADVGVGEWFEWKEMWMKSGIVRNFRPKHVVQLINNSEPISQRREFKYRRHWVAADVIVEAVHQRQIYMLHQPVDKRRRAARLFAATKHRNWCRLRHTRSRAWHHLRSTIFSVRRAGRLTCTDMSRSQIAMTVKRRCCIHTNNTTN